MSLGLVIFCSGLFIVILSLVSLGIDHDPVDDKINDVLPRACERSRGNIFTRKNHLIQGKRGEMRARGRHNGGASRSRSVWTQAADELLRDGMPIDTARLPVPLHHQTMEGCHQDARLSFHLHIRTELARLDANA